MGSGKSIRLVNIFGIRIGIDPTWFLVLFLIIWILSGWFGDVMPNASTTTVYVLATVSALIFFFSIVLHELGHALVAIRNKIGISGIDLWMFGGVAKMTKDTDSPGVEFKVAIAGPIVTLLIALLCGAIGVIAVGGEDFLEAMRLEPGTQISGGLAMLAYLTSINIIVLVFNLIPAFPLDGGRVARSIAWKITGKKSSATRFAARLGRAFAYLFIAIGVLQFVVLDNAIGGIWLAAIGFILHQAARGAEQQSAVSSRFEGLTVADVMDSDPVMISKDLTVDEASDKYFLRYGFPWFPVVDGAERYVGVLDRSQIDSMGAPELSASMVSDVMTPDAEGRLQIDQDEALESLLGGDALGRIGALFVVDVAGQLRGVITIDHVRRVLQERGVSVQEG